MAEKRCLPSLHSNFDHDSSKPTQMGFTTVSGVTSIVGGASEGSMAAHPNTTATYNNSRLVQAPTQPLLGGESSILPVERNENFSPRSSKRPKGRPLGSKNKPKNHADILEEGIDNILNLILIEIPVGNDIAESLIDVARRRNASITVLSGSGIVSDVTLMHPTSGAPAPPMSGHYNMVYLSGTYINPNWGHVPPQLIKNPTCSSFFIHMSGIQGQVCGGFVGGKVMAAGQVMVTATVFNQSVFYKLPSTSGNIEEDEEDEIRYVVGVPNAGCALAKPNIINNK